jgi:hypothetical protein
MHTETGESPNLQSGVPPSEYNHFRRCKMPERQVPNVPNNPPSPLPEESREDFDMTLMGLYPDVDWSEADRDFLRHSGLI